MSMASLACGSVPLPVDSDGCLRCVAVLWSLYSVSAVVCNLVASPSVRSGLSHPHTHPSPSCSRLTSVARVTFDACRYPGSQSTKMNYTLFHRDERKTNLEREIQKKRHKQRTDSVELCDYGHRYIPWPTHPLLLTR